MPGIPPDRGCVPHAPAVPSPPPSAQGFGKNVRVEPHDESGPLPNGRGSELPRSTHDQPQDLFIGGSSIGHIEMDGLLPLRHIQIRDPLQKVQGPISVDGILRVLNLSVTYVILRKKLLRAFAAGSARAVVPPFQRLGHGFSCSVSEVMGFESTTLLGPALQHVAPHQTHLLDPGRQSRGFHPQDLGSAALTVNLPTGLFEGPQGVLPTLSLQLRFREDRRSW